MRSVNVSSLLLLAVVTTSLAACTAQSGRPDQHAAGGTPTTMGPMAGSGGGGGSAGGGGGDSAKCTTPAAPTTPLRRLTRFEYNNTVRQLAKVMDAPANNFPPEDIGSGFGTDASKQSVGDVLIGKYMSAAKSM